MSLFLITALQPVELWLHDQQAYFDGCSPILRLIVALHSSKYTSSASMSKTRAVSKHTPCASREKAFRLVVQAQVYCLSMGVGKQHCPCTHIFGSIDHAFMQHNQKQFECWALTGYSYFCGVKHWCSIRSAEVRWRVREMTS